MERLTGLGIIGSFLLVVGVFLPAVSAPILGAASYAQLWTLHDKVRWDYIVIGMSVVSLLFTLVGAFGFQLLFGGGFLALFGFQFFQLHHQSGGFVQLQMGGVVLISGALLLFLVGLAAIGGEVHKDVVRGPTLLLALLLVTGDVQAAPSPRKLGVVYWLHGEELVELERTAFAVERKTDVPGAAAKMVGKNLLTTLAQVGIARFGGGAAMQTAGGLAGLALMGAPSSVDYDTKTTIATQGMTSPVRITESRPTFVVRSPTFNAHQGVITKLESIRGVRRVTADTTSDVNGNERGTSSARVMAFEAETDPNDPAVIRIQPKGVLPAGEYAIGNAQDAFCFAIDSGKKPAIQASENPGVLSYVRAATAAANSVPTPANSPEETLEAFIAAQERGDLDGAAALVSRRSRPEFTESSKAAGKDAFQQQGHELRAAAYVADGRQSISTRRRFASSTGKKIVLVREGDAWRVDPRRTAKSNE